MSVSLSLPHVSQSQEPTSKALDGSVPGVVARAFGSGEM
ncbi:hypothetical protein BTZ20_5367 [Rhodococcus sp. MTM3W5.2]|nr:hypothetical protein BTZ20_5367 [Rhodococcus sp. MTM3W5.2]